MWIFVFSVKLHLINEVSQHHNQTLCCRATWVRTFPLPHIHIHTKTSRTGQKFNSTYNHKTWFIPVFTRQPDVAGKVMKEAGVLGNKMPKLRAKGDEKVADK